MLIAHQTEGRTRLRAAIRPVDEGELTRFADAVGTLPGVEGFDCRASTGSLVIEHPELDWDDLVPGVLQLGGVIMRPESGVTPYRDSLAPVRNSLGNVDGLLSQLTAGGVDMRTLAFLLMFGLGLRQILRGQVMVPAMSFLWWAGEILLRPPRDKGRTPEKATD